MGVTLRVPRDWSVARDTPATCMARRCRDIPSVWQNISFWFATGGAGFCLSRSLALKMLPLAG
ncbi:lethal(3)malignant brain tumor-like protein [Homalodisca vitripennis]|nr:lethal(3)malignant brain tumor-like protein [Homalodisca vitripennis]